MVNRDTIEMIVRKRQRVDISGIQNNFEELSKRMKAFVNERTEREMKIAVWGASHQGFTVLSTTGVSKNIQYICGW